MTNMPDGKYVYEYILYILFYIMVRIMQNKTIDMLFSVINRIDGQIFQIISYS